MAAALSYRTVFGLIPMLAIGVAVLGGFATDEQVTQTVERVLELSGLSEIVVEPEAADTPAQTDALPDQPSSTALDVWLKSLVAKVRSVSFVAIGVGGLFILAYAAISFMVEIERSANHIYRAPTGRSWVRRITQYWTTLTLGSIFLVGTFYVGEQAQEVLTNWTTPQKQTDGQSDPNGTPPAQNGAAGDQAPADPPAPAENASPGQPTEQPSDQASGQASDQPGEQAADPATDQQAGTDPNENTENDETKASIGAMAAGMAVSLLIDFILLFFVYTTVPNARVNMRCAAIGAAIAAVFWETGKWGFKIFVANSSTETLYGAIALVPLFLLWVYITWIIVLSGLQISYVLQHFGSFAAEEERRGPTLVDPLTLLRVAIEVARRFAAGDRAAVADVANAVGLDEHTSLTMLERLADAHILNQVPEGQEREVFALARPADQIDAAELLQLAGRMTESRGDFSDTPRLARLRRAQLEAAEGATLADLVADHPAPPRPASETHHEPQAGQQPEPGVDTPQAGPPPPPPPTDPAHH